MKAERAARFTLQVCEVKAMIAERIAQQYGLKAVPADIQLTGGTNMQDNGAIVTISEPIEMVVRENTP